MCWQIYGRYKRHASLITTARFASEDLVAKAPRSSTGFASEDISDMCRL